jgi:VWFA-related protein
VRLVLMTATVVVGALPLGQEKPSVAMFPSAVELITVDAVVLDKDGHPVSGLTKEDFAVSEDGKPQTIASFEAFNLQRTDEATGTTRSFGPVATNLHPKRPTASSFVLVVDDLSLAPARRDTVRTALTRFLAEGVRDGDELIVATTSGDAWWSARMPEGREDVLALVARVRGRNLADNASDAVSEWEAYRITHLEGKGGDGGATGRPEGTPVRTQPGLPPQSVPGADATQRVVDRYYQRRVCNPDPVPPPNGPPMTPPWVCRGMVQARAEAVDLRRAQRTRDVLAAVDRAVFALTGVRGRKSLLLLTEGFLNDTDLPGQQEVAGRCREANIAVYSLDVRGLIAGLPGAQDVGAPNTAELGLMQAEHVDFEAAGSVELAEDTGGFAVRNTNDLAGGTSRVAEESRVYYLLGYTPPPGKGPRDWRKLKVDVKRPGLKARARKGYTLRTIAEIVAAAEGRIAAKAQRKPTRGATTSTLGPPLPADVARALASAHDADAIPLRAMAYVFEERPGGTLRTVITVEVGTSALANLGGEERPRTVLSLSIAATHRDSGQLRRVDQHVEVDAGATRAWQGWLTLSREFELPPGVAQARVVVRDEFLGLLGAVTVRFVVPPVTGLRVSTPVLTPRLWPRKEGTPLQPVLLARRDFSPSGLLYCQFQVFGVSVRGGPGPQVEASVELRRGNGEVVRRGSPSLIAPSPDGRLVHLLGLPLDGLAEGDYELRLRVEDKATGQTREYTEPLWLSARTG